MNVKSTVEILLAAATAFALAACGGASTPHVAASATSIGYRGGSSAATFTKHGAARAARTIPKGNATALVDEWAACMRSHGDPNQADPLIDAYGVINIDIPAPSQQISGAVHAGADSCDRYLAAAQAALRAANPVAPPPDQAGLLKYVSCMRANGVPNYPDPTGNTTNFNGTGVDPTSPFVVTVSKACGRKLKLPAWWAAGTGPPGDVVVTSGGGPNGPPRQAPRAVPGGHGGG